MRNQKYDVYTLLLTKHPSDPEVIFAAGHQHGYGEAEQVSIIGLKELDNQAQRILEA